MGLTFQSSPHEALSAYASITEHSSPDLKVFDETRYDFFILFIGFPAVKWAARFNNYFDNILMAKRRTRVITKKPRCSSERCDKNSILLSGMVSI